MTKVLVLYYSSYGHVEAMARAEAEGARAGGGEAVIKRVPELVPLDVAKMAAYLCSGDSGFITGQTFVVDGGTTALMSLMTDFRNESNMRFGANFIPEP